MLLLFQHSAAKCRVKKTRVRNVHSKYPLYASMPKDLRALRESAHKRERQNQRAEFKQRVLSGQATATQ